MTESFRRRRLLEIAMDLPDVFAAEIQYADSKGQLTRRTISPIKYKDGLIVALCLSRDALRTFKPSRVKAVRLVFSHMVFTPAPIYRRRKLAQFCE